MNAKSSAIPLRATVSISLPAASNSASSRYASPWILDRHGSPWFRRWSGVLMLHRATDGGGRAYRRTVRAMALAIFSASRASSRMLPLMGLVKPVK